MKIGIVGLCHSHPVTFTKALKEEPGIEVPYVYDSDKEAVRDFIGQFGGTALNSPAEFVEKNIDAAVITVKTNRHLAAAKIFIEAGIPVFVDKPLAMNPKEARELIELAKKKNGIMLSSSALRYAPSFDVLIKKTRSGEMGKPLTAMVNVFYGIHVVYEQDPTSWQLTEEEASGLIYNFGIHAVEPLIAGLGIEVKSVLCHSNPVNLPPGFNDVTVINIEFRNGAVGIGRLVGSTTVSGYQMEVHGTKESLYAPDMETYGKYGEEAIPFGAESSHGYAPMMKEFLRCVEQRKNLLPWEETYKVIETLEAAKISARKGRLVELG